MLFSGETRALKFFLSDQSVTLTSFFLSFGIGNGNDLKWITYISHVHILIVLIKIIHDLFGGLDSAINKTWIFLN